LLDIIGGNYPRLKLRIFSDKFGVDYCPEEGKF